MLEGPPAVTQPARYLYLPFLVWGVGSSSILFIFCFCWSSFFMYSSTVQFVNLCRERAEKKEAERRAAAL